MESMNWEQRFKHFLMGHGSGNKQCPGGYVNYCPECGKILHMEIQLSIISDSDKEWLMKTGKA